MKEKTAKRLAVKTMLLSEMTDIEPNTVIKYLALMEAIPDADILLIGTVLELCIPKVKELIDADRGIHVTW